MAITHVEAQKLIQLDADDALEAAEKKALALHLESCPTCRTYAGRLRELETSLRHSMKKRWSQVPLPLQQTGAASQRRSGITKDIIFATRILAMSVICAAFLFNIWQFTQPTAQGPGPDSQVTVPPVPTPSTMTSTSTMVEEVACEGIDYAIRQGDTLAGIAATFSVPVEEIMKVNHLSTEDLTSRKSLTIPGCNRTPASSTVITTFTPLLRPASSTPANNLTQ